MQWINFLHLYQPANNNGDHIREATEKSYQRILRGLEEHPDTKFTFNISGSLLLRWEDLGYEKLFTRVKHLINKKQLELTGSAAYHPILPLLSDQEIIWQIKENEKIIKRLIDKNIKLTGFFLPEMAYDLPTAKIIKKLGYKWLILDDFAYQGKEKENDIDYNQSYEDQAGLKIAFRSRSLSGSYIPDMLNNHLKSKAINETIITATDAEIYGLRHEDPTAEFEKILKLKLKTLTISEYLKTLTKNKKIKLVDSSWESTVSEIKNGLPFAVWYNPKNKIQKLLWELADQAIYFEAKHKKDKNHYWSRWHLVRGLASCTFWWASGKDFRQVFGPIAWNPDEIDKGTNELIRAIRSLETVSAKEKINAEKLYAKIRLLVWEAHWDKHSNKK